MSKRLFFFLILIAANLFLGACDQINSVTESADVSQLQNAPFYTALQATVAGVQIPVILVGLLSLLLGWKLKRFGLALNGFVIGGLMLYTYLGDSGLIPDETFRLGLSIVGAIISGLLAYFLYNLMALIIGGAIGSMLMNGAWLQVADNVPPQLLVFITTFVSALLMFFVFRLFLVAFSAVIGAVILMLALPFETLWVIPVAAIGTGIQMMLALWMKDDIFQNLRGDFGAALGQAFGEILGPIGTLRDYQKGSKEEKVAQGRSKPESRPARQEKKPEPQRQVAPVNKPAQQPYQPAQQPYQAPPANRPAQQPYQAPPVNKPAQPQQPYQAPVNKPVQAQQPYQAPQAEIFRPENYQIVLSTGQSVPLLGSQVTVGRNADNTIVLNDPLVSSYHMIFSIQAEGVVVWDNNSTNGTLLNGILLTGAARLSTSDILQVGAVSLRLVRVGFQ
jgi:pSer/pThr/pTyr-binding forkhead associated (FHA) protein